MTRASTTDRLRVDPPPVPVDAAFMAVLAAQAAASRPTPVPRRTRSRLAVALVAAAVAVTTLTAAWGARELATRPPAPASHERRVEPVPDLPPSPSPIRHAQVEETADDPRPTEEPQGTRRQGRTGQRSTPDSEAARSSAPHAPATAPTTRPRHDDGAEDRESPDDDVANGTDDHAAGDDPTDGTDDHGGGDDPTDGGTPDDRPGPTDDATDGVDGPGDSGDGGSGTRGSGTGADDVTDGDVGEELVTRGD